MLLPFIPWSIAGVPSSQALPGFLITAPPSACVPDVIGALACGFQTKKKQKNPPWNSFLFLPLCSLFPFFFWCDSVKDACKISRRTCPSGFRLFEGRVTLCFCTRCKDTDMFFFVGVTTPHGHPKPWPPDKVRIWTDVRTGYAAHELGPQTGRPDVMQFQPVRFPGIPRCPNEPETPETRKPDGTFQPRRTPTVKNGAKARRNGISRHEILSNSKRGRREDEGVFSARTYPPQHMYRKGPKTVQLYYICLVYECFVYWRTHLVY